MRGSVSRLFGLTAFLLVLAGATAALGADGGVRVTVYEVTDAGNEPMPGATVILSHPGGQFPEAGAVTDANGQALFPVVPALAGYAVKVSMPGYATTVRDGVKVVPNQITDVVVALTPEKTEEVTVVGKEKLIDLEKGTESKTEISAEFFEDLPVLGREYQNVLSLAPGVNDTDGDGNPTVHGSRARDFQAQVDGVSNVDPLTGYFMSNINPDAIEEIEVIDFGADASYGGAVGGYAKIHTKSGTNQFEGAFNFFLRDSAADNDRAGNIDPVDFGRIQPSLFLSGPLIRNRMWWVVSHEYLDQSDPVDVIGGGDFVQKFNRWTHLDKLTWQVGPKSKLALQFSADPIELTPLDASAIVPAASSVRYTAGGPTYSLTWNVPYSPTFALESQIAFSDINVTLDPMNPWTTLPDGRQTGTLLNSCVVDRDDTEFDDYLPGLRCRDDDLFGLTSGTANRDYEDTRQRWTYRFEGDQFINEWLGGSHRVRFGASLQRASFSRDDIRLNELRRNGIGLQGAVLGTNGSLDPNQPAYSLFETVYAPKIATDAGGAIASGMPARVQDDVDGNYFAAYITDTYEPTSNVVINLGVRFQREEISSFGYTPFDPAAERAAWNEFLDRCMAGEIPTSADPSGLDPKKCFQALGGSTLFTMHRLDVPTAQGCGGGNALNPALCELAGGEILINNGFVPKTRGRERFTISNNGIAPRFSISWDPWSDGKTLISGSFGRVYADSILLPFAFENGPDSLLRRWTLNSRLQPTRQDVPSAIGGFAISVVDRNIKMQHSDEWGLRFEREIAPETRLTLRYVNRKFYDQLQDIDVNKVPVYWDELPDQFPDPSRQGALRSKDTCNKIGPFADCYGLDQITLVENPGPGPAFIAVRQQLPDGQADLQPLNPFFSNVYKIGNFNRSYYEAYIIELVRRFYQNWQLNVSYTWSKSIGQAEDFFQQLGDDQTNIDDEFGFLADDQRHVVKVNGRVVLPWWGGIRLGGAFFYTSGLPYSIIEQRVVLDFPALLSMTDTADYSSVAPLFQQTGSTRVLFPTHQRNDRREPSWWNFDVNVEKEFTLKDISATVEFGIFNLLNSDDLRNLDGRQVRIWDAETNQFRFIRQTVAQRRQGRQFQIALRMKF